MTVMLSLASDLPGEQSDMSERDPSCGALERCFEIFAQSAATTEPGESSFNHPAPWQKLKSGCFV
jgi:hypothetical protein